MRRRHRVGSTAAARSPAISTSPAVGSSSRLMSFSVVVFPEPLRPSRTSVSPAPTLNDTSCTSCRPIPVPRFPPPPATFSLPPPPPPPRLQAVGSQALARRGPPSCGACKDHQEAAVLARALPTHREACVGQNPEERARVVLVGVVHREPLAGGERERLPAHPCRDVARRAEVLGERVQAGEPGVAAVLEDELPVRQIGRDTSE